MFEINNTKVENYGYFSVIRDFYKNPDEVVEFIHRYEPHYHKHDNGFYSQGFYFKDMRHTIWTFSIKPVWEFLSNLIDSKPLNVCDHVTDTIHTNYTYFYQIYKDRFFFPHQDPGTTALVYLDKEIANGTNIYKPVKRVEEREEHKEHYADETEFEVIAHTPSEYNKLVIWNGEHYHGLCQDDKYINQWRLNQVFFFQR